MVVGRGRTTARFVLAGCGAILIGVGFAARSYLFEWWELRRLASPDATVRRTAVHALGHMGSSRSVPRLLEVVLRDADLGPLAAVAVARIGRGDSPELVQVLESKDSNFRKLTIEAIAKAGAQAAAVLPALVASGLRANDEVTLWEASYALSATGVDCSDLIAKALRDPSLRLQAAKFLGYMGADAKRMVPALLQALSEDKDPTTSAVATAIQRIGPAAVPRLVEALKSEDERTRGLAAFALQGIGRAGRAATPVLIGALKDSSWRVRGQAARALGAIGAQAAKAIPALIELQRDAASQEHPEGVAVLPYTLPAYLEARVGELDPANPAVMTALVDALHSRYEVLSTTAAKALGAMGPAAKPAVPALAALLERWVTGTYRASPEALLTFVRALEKLGPDTQEAADVIFRTLLLAENRELKMAAARALGRTGTHLEKHLVRLIESFGEPDERSGDLPRPYAVVAEIGPAAAPALIVALSDPRPQVRAEAARALSGADAERHGTPAILVLLDDKEPSVRVAVIEALTLRIADAKLYVDHFVRALADPSQEVREAAVLALMHAGPEAKAALEPLMSLLKIGTDPIRGSVPAALASIGGPSGDVLETLFIALNDTDEIVRAAASDALRTIRMPFFPGGQHHQFPNPLPGILRFPESAGGRAERWRVAAALGLSEVQGRPANAVGALELLAAQDPDPDVRLEAALALDRIGR